MIDRLFALNAERAEAERLAGATPVVGTPTSNRRPAPREKARSADKRKKGSPDQLLLGAEPADD